MYENRENDDTVLRSFKAKRYFADYENVHLSSSRHYLTSPIASIIFSLTNLSVPRRLIIHRPSKEATGSKKMLKLER